MKVLRSQVSLGHFGGYFLYVVALNDKGERIIGNYRRIEVSEIGTAVSDLLARMETTQASVMYHSELGKD